MTCGKYRNNSTWEINYYLPDFKLTKIFAKGYQLTIFFKIIKDQYCIKFEGDYKNYVPYI